MRDEKYSVSTSQHQTHVWRAVHRKYKIFNVKYLGPFDSQLAHKGNVDHYVKKLRALADDFWRSRDFGSPRMKILFDIYHGKVEEAKEYCKRYQCSDLLPPLFGLELDGDLAKQKLEV
jgi:hypothetical protein